MSDKNFILDIVDKNLYHGIEKNIMENEYKYVPEYTEGSLNEDTRKQSILLIYNFIKIYSFSKKTFWLAVNYYDKYTIKNKTLEKKENIISIITCFIIAIKYEEITYIDLNKLIGRFEYDIKKSDIYKYEIKVLKTLDYKLYVITPYDFYHLNKNKPKKESYVIYTNIENIMLKPSEIYIKMINYE